MLRSRSAKDNICLAYLSAMRGFRSRGIGVGLFIVPTLDPNLVIVLLWSPWYRVMWLYDLSFCLLMTAKRLIAWMLIANGNASVGGRRRRRSRREIILPWNIYIYIYIEDENMTAFCCSRFCLFRDSDGKFKIKKKKRVSRHVFFFCKENLFTNDNLNILLD